MATAGPSSLITSPWGIGVLKFSGSTLAAPMMAPNGTRFGGWLLNTLDNRFTIAGDLDGDRQREILVASPWGIGVFKLSGNTFAVPMMAPNGTRFGGWLLNTADNHFDQFADFDNDGQREILVTSPWGLGIFKLAGNTFTVPMMAPNGTRFGGWLLNTADNRFEFGEQTVRLHVKVLTNPTIAVDQMVVSMRQVYEAVGARVHWVSTETLNLPALNDVDVGTCNMGSVTAEQTQLFGNRNNVWGSDVVVYFVRSTVPVYQRLCRVSGRSAGRGRGTDRDRLDHGSRGGSRARPRPCQRQQPADDRERHRQHHQSAAGPGPDGSDHDAGRIALTFKS